MFCDEGNAPISEKLASLQLTRLRRFSHLAERWRPVYGQPVSEPDDVPTGPKETGRSLRVHLLGCVEAAAFDGLQNWLAYELAGRTDTTATLLLCEQPAGVTIGADGSRDDARVCDPAAPPPTWVSRGGGAIPLGPGILTASLLLPVDRLRLGVSDLRERTEAAGIATLAALKVAAHRGESPGLFTRQGQVGWFGMSVEQGVSRGGLTIAVAAASQPLYELPGATCLDAVRTARTPMSAVRQTLASELAAAFGYDTVNTFTGHEQLRRV